MRARLSTFGAAALAVALLATADPAAATGDAGCCVCTCDVGGTDVVTCSDAVTDRECELGGFCSPDATTSFVQNGECVGEHVAGMCVDAPACADAAGATMAPAASAAGLALLAAGLAAVGLRRRR